MIFLFLGLFLKNKRVKELTFYVFETMYIGGAVGKPQIVFYLYEVTSV